MTPATAALTAWLSVAPLPSASPGAGTLVVMPSPAEPSTLAVPVAHAAALLVGMRLALSVMWPQPYDPLPLERSARQFRAAFRQPPELRHDRWLLESDGDPWAINVVGHGLFGAEVYGRVRQCGGSPWQALAFTAGTSVVWEYGIESWSKRPSAVDLVTTPVIGAALGEARTHLQRWLRRHPAGFWRRLGEVLVDPLGSAERTVLHTRC